MNRLLVYAMLIIQLVFIVLLMGFGLVLLVLGLMVCFKKGEFPAGAVVGVVFLGLGAYLLRTWLGRRKRLLAALDGDVSAAQELEATHKWNVRWTMRINGPLVCVLCVGVGVAMLFAMELPVWQRLLGCGVSCGAFVLFLALTIRAWRRPK